MARDTREVTASGGCLCGAVRYEVRGSLRSVVYCHCSQCRRTSGHFVAATGTRAEDLVLLKVGGLKWYRSSETARRGFCRECGSSLFWEPASGEPASGERVSIMAGTLDPPTGLTAAAHIFCEDASDYYDPFDGTPDSEPDGLPRIVGGDYSGVVTNP